MSFIRDWFRYKHVIINLQKIKIIADNIGHPVVDSITHKSKFKFGIVQCEVREGKTQRS